MPRRPGHLLGSAAIHRAAERRPGLLLDASDAAAPKGTIRYLDPTQPFPDEKAIVIYKTASASNKQHVIVNSDSSFVISGAPGSDFVVLLATTRARISSVLARSLIRVTSRRTTRCAPTSRRPMFASSMLLRRTRPASSRENSSQNRSRASDGAGGGRQREAIGRFWDEFSASLDVRRGIR